MGFPAFGKGKVQGKFTKGWDNGKGKGGKEKGPKNGHLKERTRITADKFTGEVTAWKGKYGWITPSEEVQHEKATKHNGSLFVSINDIGGLPALNMGDQVAFHIFEDDDGLGADDVEVTAAGAGGGGKSKGADKGKSKSFGKAADWGKGSTWGKAAAAPQAAWGSAEAPMCKFFLEGRCAKGDACTFSHGSQAPQKGGWGGSGTAEVMCKFFQEGRCSKGDGCNFSHGQGSGKSSKSFGKACGKFDSWKGAASPFGKGKDGKDKGKGKDGKGKNKTPGHMLERTRITAEKFTGEVTKWQGKFGFIKPAEEVQHEKAAKHNGCLFVSCDDIEGDNKELTVGSLCEFHIWEDKSGLGADEVIQY